MGSFPETPVRFPSGNLELEGLLHLPQTPRGAVVVCHPHPLFGGEMHNGVVLGMCIELAHGGFAVLRFNFRGAGESDGEHDGGVGEVDDVHAAVAFVRATVGLDLPIDVAGYSFGGWVGLLAGAADPHVRALAAVAPPTSFLDMTGAGNSSKPKLVVYGEFDAFAKPAEFQPWLKALPEPIKYVALENADHFLRGREREAGQLLSNFLLSLNNS